MAKKDPFTIRCRCCNEPFETVREGTETCSPKCRQRVWRMVSKGWNCEWGTFARYFKDRRPPGLGVRTVKKQRLKELRKAK